MRTFSWIIALGVLLAPGIGFAQTLGENSLISHTRPGTSADWTDKSTGTLADLWVETQSGNAKAALEPDADSAVGATRIAIHHCTENANSASCKPLNIMDTNADGIGDSNVVTGTPPQRGFEWTSVPGWIWFEVTAQPLTGERPMLLVNRSMW